MDGIVPFSRHLGDGLDLEGGDHGFVPARGVLVGFLKPIGREAWRAYRTFGNDLIQAAVHIEDGGRQWTREGVKYVSQAN